MRLLVIRHAEPELPGPPLLEDPPLSPVGRAQAARLAESLQTRALDRVVCSSMRRAIETATPLAERLGVPLVVEPDLVEIAMGELAPWGPDEQAEWALITARWQRGEFQASCPGGEGLEDVIARVGPVVTRLASDSGQRGFAIVAHAVVNGVVLPTLCEDLRPALGRDLGHSYTGVWELERTGSGFAVVRRDDTSHLGGDGNG
jgi:2,3-bisphosphoglycerate-dependent phosphoglycerate mutase